MTKNRYDNETQLGKKKHLIVSLHCGPQYRNIYKAKN